VQVFIERDIQDDGTDRLQFLDPLSGEIDTVLVNGERYTPFGAALMFFDRAANRVMLVTPDGRLRNHPFIQPLSDTRRIDWLVSADGRKVAWTSTANLGDTQLQTTTYVANIDGSSPKQILVDGPRAGIRALPVAFSPDDTILYMDYQPDGIADLTPFPQYAGLFAVNIDTGESALLPGEPGCYCGAGLGAGLLLRLDLGADLSGFDVVVTNLVAQTSERIEALRLTNYTQAGDVLVSSDGRHAVYALAQIQDFGGANQSVQTVFVLVDLVEKRQETLTQPVTTFMKPLSWTEDNTAVLFTSADPTQDGTWKLSLSDGRPLKVANATYLGTLR
jgi:hypothetical protein